MLVFARFGLMADLALLMGLPLFWWAWGMAGSRYGWLLGGTLLRFAGMLGLAALNRWRLTPALERGDGAIGALRLSLAVETGAAIAIMTLVALLGTLDPIG